MFLRFIALTACIVGSLSLPPPLNNNPNSNLRIIGGVEVAEPNAYAYIVSLIYKQKHVCAGAFVHKEYVITAAHCVDGETPDKFTIKAGTQDLTKPGQEYTVVEITKHEKYNSTNVINDVAILKVARKNPTDLEIDGIPVLKSTVGDDDPVTFAGWGSTKTEGAHSNVLQQIKLETISFEKCQAAHKHLGINKDQICTEAKDNLGAWCYGDSGGPLIIIDTGVDLLVGIASWGTPCGRKKPDVFGRLTSHIDWIHKKCNCLTVVEQTRTHL